VQRGKELSMVDQVEPQVNQQLLRFMEETRAKTLEELEQKMREAGYDINEVRRNLRNKFLIEAVRNREVYQEIYFKLTEKEKREYYDKHKDIFTIPGTVTLSQIFIASGNDPEQALARARDVVSLARAPGADFPALVQRYSEDEATKKDKGRVGPLDISQLKPEVRDAVGSAPIGTITDPIKVDVGYLIFRIDERKEPTLKPFEDEETQRLVAYRMTEERGAEKFESYLAKLRADAFIEIDPRYQNAVTKNKSAQIKRSPWTDEKKDKKKKDQEKKDPDKKEVGKEDPKTTVKTKL
jgi:parvulin-like peptidyl-prolyl isomerase